MKISTFFILLFGVLVGCNKDNSSKEPDIPYFDFKIYQPGTQENGSATATVFDKEWNASVLLYRWPDSTSQYFQVFFETYSEFGDTRDQVSIGIFDGKVGVYQITNNAFDTNFDDFSITGDYSFWISDGDLLYKSYFIDETFDNKVVIDKNDGENIEGQFSLSFTSSVTKHTDVPGRIFFKSGKFRFKL